MESEIAERVGESSTRRTRPKTNRKSLAEPPLLPRSSQKKRRPRREATPAREYKEYPARKILDQKKENGRIKYLIDWEDDKVTKENFEPTWVPQGEVGSLLIANWQKEGRDNLESSGGNIEQESSVALSQDSEPVRPAKRQRTAQDPNLASQERPSPKKPRKAGTVQTARFQSASQETFESQGGPSGIKDSYEEEGQLSSNELRDVFVEVHVRKSFDRDAYVTVAPSQLSCNPQPDQYSQPSEQSLHAPSQSQFQTFTPHPSRTAFIWDEDIVPDSQEAGSSSYKPSETATSKSGFPTRPNIGNNTEADLDFINSQQGSSRGETTDSGDVEAHVEEHSSYRARTSYLQEESQNNPRRPGLNTETPLIDPQVETSWEDPQGSPRPESSYSGGVANESAPSVNLSIRSETSHSNFSSEIQASSVDHLASPIARGQGTWLEEAAGILNQLQPLQPSQIAIEKSPSPQFQSQLLSASDNKDGIEDCDDSGQLLDDFVESTDHSHNGPQLLNQHSSIPEEPASRTLGPELQYQSSPQRTGKSISSFEATSLSIPEEPASHTLGSELQYQSSLQRTGKSISSFEATSLSIPEEPASHTLGSELQYQSSPQRTGKSISSFEATSLSIPEEPASRTLGPEPQYQSSPQRTGKSVSSFEATSLSARAISSTPQPSAQVLPAPPTTTILGKGNHQLPRFIPGRDILSPVEPTPLTQLRVDLQRSQSTSPRKTPPKFSSHKSSDYLPQQVPDKVIPSIERIVEASSSPPSRPSPPSSGLAQLPETYGSNLPTRPSLPSESDMEDQLMNEDGEIDARQMLKQARANATAKRAAEQAVVRATSAIPQSLPSPPVAANQMLPLRETIAEVPTFVTPRAPSPKFSPELEPAIKSLHVLPVESNDYYVPLPMNAYTRDIYNQIMINHKHQRLALLEDEQPDTSVVEDIDLMIKDLEVMCDHPDLVAEDFASQRMAPENEQVGYAENVSTKCIFLAEFLEAIRSFETHVAILVRPGRMLEILEALLRYHGYTYHRPDRPSFVSQSGRGALKITILPTGLGERTFSTMPASIVIAFDRSFQGEQYAMDLRADPTDPGKKAPLVSLVVAHSIEHLELCFNENISPIYRMMKLVNCLKDIGDGVGVLSHEYLPPPEAAKAVATFAFGGTADSLWPLLPMPEIDGITLSSEASVESELKQAQLSGSTTQSYNTSLPTPQSGFKRQLESEDIMNPESSKRQRLTPVPGEQNAPLDGKHVSETVLNSSGEKPFPKASEAEEIIAKTDALDNQQESQISSLLTKINDLEGLIQSKESAEIELRQRNQSLEARIQDYESSILQIQPKYQEALNDRGHFEHETNLSLARESTLRRNLESRITELTKLREEKGAVDAELAAARKALSTSSVPEIAELNTMRDSLSTAKTENERLQKRLGNLQSEIEYMRNSCQQANTAAADAANELTSAQDEIASLKQKADANTLQIHQIQHSNEIAQHLKRIGGLETENKELEKDLERKSEELRTLLNARRQTRGSSAPRSPRMGTQGSIMGTMSPRPIGRVMGIPVTGGSRGNSPGPGEMPVRGMWAGEVLFQGPQARWGNHLQ